MAKMFDDILLKGIRAGQVPGRTQDARQWYRDQAKALPKKNQTDRLIRELRTDSNRRQDTRFLLGNMYLFAYDPKHKETLPYYDRFPLIFPINKAKGGFLGINLHYLPPPFRAKLMDELYTVMNNKAFNDTTRLTANYKILNSTTKFKHFKPCIKHYLNAQVRSKPAYINPTEWDVALFLPTQKFVGATTTQVYADSRKIIRGM
jgi:hypothetical protein